MLVLGSPIIAPHLYLCLPPTLGKPPFSSPFRNFLGPLANDVALSTTLASPTTTPTSPPPVPNKEDKEEEEVTRPYYSL